MKGVHAWRYNLVVFFYLTLAIAIVVRIVVLQFDENARKLGERTEWYARTMHTYFPARGQIFDRWGNLLAGNRQVYEVGVNLYLVENPETIAFAMSKVMAKHPVYGRPEYYGEVFTTASLNPAEVSSNYQVVADFVTQEELDQLLDWARRYEDLQTTRRNDPNPDSLAGLVFRPRPQRYYPEGDLASSILGFVNWEGVGIFGVEQEFNDYLSGKPQTLLVPVDPYRATDLPEVKGGSDLVLTLDRAIQARVEEILDEAIASSGSASGTIIVMDPRNGEILAMASTPRFDLNRFYEYDTIVDSDAPFNQAVSRIYEPGSVFKVLTMAAALDSGLVTPDTTFTDTGSIEIGGIYIRNWNYGAWGQQTMTGCMQHSLNVCLAWLAKEMGPTVFYTYLERFNIGRPTGIDIANEVNGVLRLPGDQNWYEGDLGTNSFGQGVAVSPIQLAMAISSVANGGEMVMPHIMRTVVMNGRPYSTTKSVVGKPISAETARTLTEMLAVSLEEEASNALVNGYRVAGKTGTAEIATETGYSSSATNASFVGWGPVDDPQFLVYVWLEKPQSSPWGSVVAAPVFSQVFKELVVLTGLPPDAIRQQLNGD